jgi:hypothetical protein
MKPRIWAAIGLGAWLATFGLLAASAGIVNGWFFAGVAFGLAGLVCLAGAYLVWTRWSGQPTPSRAKKALALGSVVAFLVAGIVCSLSYVAYQHELEPTAATWCIAI